MHILVAYALKLLTVTVVEKLAIIALTHLVAHTESKVDDEILAVVEAAIKGEK
jgi:hypothetical protein